MTNTELQNTTQSQKTKDRQNTTQSQKTKDRQNEPH